MRHPIAMNVFIVFYISTFDHYILNLLKIELQQKLIENRSYLFIKQPFKLIKLFIAIASKIMSNHQLLLMAFGHI